MSCERCAPDTATEELLAFMDVVAEETQRRMEALVRQRDDAEREIASLNGFTEFAATLRRQVEAGQVAAQAALIELVPRRFSTSEFVSNLHEFKARRAS